MKKLLMLLSLIIVVTFSACKPEPTPEPEPTPTTCTVTFWTDDDAGEEIEVNLMAYDYDYDLYRYIRKYYSDSSNPGCDSDGCANFYDVKPGDYYFYAENSYYEWEGDLRVEKECTTMKLNISKSRAKAN